VFSHYRLRADPLQWRNVVESSRIAEDADLRWVSQAQLDTLGLPAPIRKLLDSLAG
jgi:A/G-specific adenine glycosylase